MYVHVAKTYMYILFARYQSPLQGSGWCKRSCRVSNYMYDEEEYLYICSDLCLHRFLSSSSAIPAEIASHQIVFG